MFSAYILYSISFQISYVGQTSDLENRLKGHNGAENTGYTNRFKRFVIFRGESLQTRTEALKRER